ncbi:6689_t:CDS:1, partial [Funneliformis mosseae]
EILRKEISGILKRETFEEEEKTEVSIGDNTLMTLYDDLFNND